MIKLYRILGKRGRITIPYEMRQRVGFAQNDVLSFTEQADKTIIVQREKICDQCRNCSETHSSTEKANGITLMEFLDNLSPDEQRAALIHLSGNWAKKQKEMENYV